MSQPTIEPRPLVRALGKEPRDFSPTDLARAAAELDLAQLNLRYVGGDGRLKMLSFPIDSTEQLVSVLRRGERVDGSSVFPDTDTEASDCYIVPRWSTAFVNPFGVRPALDVLCAMYDEQGRPLAHAREQVVRRASEALTEATGLVLEAMGELEFYVVEDEDPLFPAESETGYQESPPFSKAVAIREEILHHLSSFGLQVKYVHGEVGTIREEGRQLSQGEIEFLPVPAPEAADAVVIAKWVVREVAAAHGVAATFAPSVSADGAGNGLHVHTRLVRGDDNVIVDADGLNDAGRQLVVGYLELAKALTAFGNTVPTSYLRFLDGEESPEKICWGERDRTGLVRVPLAWTGDVLPGMLSHANPGSDEPAETGRPHPQTAELRLGDGSADAHLLIAGMCVAARLGLADKRAVKKADKLDAGKHSRFDELPKTCAESADELERARKVFEAEGVFPAALLDGQVRKLRALDDGKGLRKLAKDETVRAELVRRFWHVG